MLQFGHLTSASKYTTSWITLGWAALIILSLAAVLIAMGTPAGPAVLFGGAVAFLFAYRYPYATYGLMVLMVPLLGITVSLPTGTLDIGERAFGGSIDISAGELVAMALLAAWVMKVIMLWLRRHDTNWKPWLPLAIPMAALVGAHVLSAKSGAHPDVVLVVKYAIRPVLWCYLIYVVLTVNVIRSRSKLAMVLGIVATTGILAAFMGLASLGVPDRGDQLLPRARPLPVFGYMPLGDNHNLLAEWLIVTLPSTIALALMMKDARGRRLLAAAAMLQLIVALVTFARTAWIVLAVEAFFLGMYVWRERVMHWIRPAMIGALLLLPIAAAMFAFSNTSLVQGSTSTRLMLTEIALHLWSASPWIGMGAGTFADRVGSTWIFVTEYGAPLDSHGFIQKLLAETGIVGLAAALWVAVGAWLFVSYTRKRLAKHSVELQIFTVLAVSVLGALVYQLFNTNYWTGKLWLPLGIMLAASRALLPPSNTVHKEVDVLEE